MSVIHPDASPAAPEGRLSKSELAAGISSEPGTGAPAASPVRWSRRSPGTWWALVKDALSAWIDDYAPSMGAALSYYSVFSLGRCW